MAIIKFKDGEEIRVAQSHNEVSKLWQSGKEIIVLEVNISSHGNATQIISIHRDSIKWIKEHWLG